MRAQLVIFAFLPLLLSGCINSSVGDPPEPWTISFPPNLDESRLLSGTHTLPEGSWYVREDFEGWIFFIHQVNGVEGIKLDYTANLWSDADQGSVLFVNPTLGMPVGPHTIDAFAPHSIGGLGIATVVDFSQLDVEEDSILFFAAYATDGATLEMELHYGTGGNHLLQPVGFEASDMEADRAEFRFANDGVPVDIHHTPDSSYAALGLLDQATPESEEQTFLIQSGPIHRYSSSGAYEDQTNTGWVDAIGVLAIPSGEVRLQVHQEGDGTQKRSGLFITEPNDLAGWFEDQFSKQLIWTASSTPNDMDWFTEEDEHQSDEPL